jgi:ATP sulfurylase
MGCSHFIVGRDHSGVGSFYAPDANRKLFDSLGDLGVEPVFFDAIGYNAASGCLEADRGQPLEMISGTEVRDTLRAEKHLPDWFMRELVQEVLIAEIRNGKPVFYDS